LKASGAGIAAASLSTLGVNAVAHAVEPSRVRYAKETSTICPYCSVGCGIIVHSEKGKVVNTEGDPDHPINKGSLCSKGSALYQVANNELRLTKVQYRAPGSDRWEEKDWAWALNKIAENVKKTRDAHWILRDAQGNLVNRTEAIASLGGAALDNEECYLISKLFRALGVVYLEHQARI